MEVLVQKDLLTNQGLYNVGLGLVPVVAMRPMDVRRFATKRRLAAYTSDSVELLDIWIPISESALMNLALTKWLIEAALLPTDKESRKSQTVAEIFLSFYSMILSLAYDMLALEKRYRSFADLHWVWSNKVTMTNAEKITTLECLQVAPDWEKIMVEHAKKQEEETSQLKAKLESARIDSESAHTRKKRHEISLLRKEHDDFIMVLERERKKLQSTETKLASTKKEAKLAQGVLSQAREQAIEDYHSLEDFKEAILKGGSISYWIGYEDGRNVVEKFYPNLDLSCITIPGADGEDELTDAVDLDPLIDEAAVVSIDVELIAIED
ncbi:hypothetical protein COCNU_scaffold019741G000010 [Cocos nucifera]|nr:hypothetical protein [Cocos nucifera]